jgi:myo-inositol-1-phosphate synthase
VLPALIEGVSYYREHLECAEGLMLPRLCFYTGGDMKIVSAFDLSAAKVGMPAEKAIYQAPNNSIPIKAIGEADDLVTNRERCSGFPSSVGPRNTEKG